MNQIALRYGLLGLAVWLGLGCASNPELNRARLPEFTDGKTTLVEVVQRLGPPNYRTPWPSG